MNNWKMRCLDSHGMDCYTDNKIYEVIDGIFYDDDNLRGGFNCINFYEWEKRSLAKWELIEEPKQALEKEEENG